MDRRMSRMFLWYTYVDWMEFGWLAVSTSFVDGVGHGSFEPGMEMGNFAWLLRVDVPSPHHQVQIIAFTISVQLFFHAIRSIRSK